MNLACFNTRHREYNSVLKKMKIKRKPKFNTQGRLCICLIEFRNMIEIDYVIRAVLKMYPGDYEIGLSLVYIGFHWKHCFMDFLSSFQYVSLNLKEFRGVLVSF